MNPYSFRWYVTAGKTPERTCTFLKRIRCIVLWTDPLHCSL